MFRFDFNVSTNEKVDSKEGPLKEDVKGSTISENGYSKCVEIFPTEEQMKEIELDQDFEVNSVDFHNRETVYHVPLENVIEKITSESEDIECAEKSNSDVVPGIYEGGAKVWECTQDLGDFLTKKDESDKCLLDEFTDKSVLDLGCGGGILGILALKNAKVVHFQDYNKSVLQHITIPNVLLNLDNNQQINSRAKFFSGDWLNYITLNNATKFDYILTSETIYNPENYLKIVKTLKEKLNANGVCYLATKVYYFGVGGSAREFERILKDDGTFQSEVIFACNENVKREILKITYCNK